MTQPDSQQELATLFRQAVAVHRRRDHAAAEPVYRQLLERCPRDARIQYFLGLLLHQTGRHAEAVPLLRQAFEAQPRAAAGFRLLIECLLETGAAQEAVRLCTQRTPVDARVHTLAARALVAAGDRPAAEKRFAKALALEPRRAETHHHLAVFLHRQGRLDGALDHYRAAALNGPRDATVHLNLAMALQEHGDLGTAREHYRVALAIEPAHLEALYRLAYVEAQLCDWSALERVTGTLLDELRAYCAGQGAARLPPFVLNVLPVDEHWHDCVAGRYAAAFQAQAGPPLHGDRARHGGRLRVGYLSADLCSHAVGDLVFGIFAAHDRKAFEIHVYSLRRREDPVQSAVRAGCEHFHDVADWAADDIARRIAADGIDLLIDLGGYTHGARPEILAARPAPVQLSWLGYLNTMAAGFVDYVIADRSVLPPEQEGRYREAVLRLPGSFLVSSPIEAAPVPTRAEWGLPDGDFVFCSFNDPGKIDRAVFASWMRILAQCPGTVLWLYSGGRREVEENLRAAAIQAGTDPARIIFAGPVSLAEHLGRLRAADLFLDAFRYNGGASAMCALMAGVPVLTCTGECWLARLGTSLNRAAGLAALICATPAAYEARAIKLVASGVADYKAGLQRRRPGDLFDTTAFVGRLERAYRALWRHHAAGRSPRSMDIDG